MSDIEDVFGPGESEPVAPEPLKTNVEKAPVKGKAKPAPKKDEVKRTWIILQKKDEIPPSGLYIGHNGVGYKLIAGKKANVPDFLLDVLDNAVVKKPMMDDDGRIAGYEDSPRFPYQVVREK